MFTVKINNKTQQFDQPIRVKDLVTDTFREYPVVLVNNRLRELSYKFQKNADIELLTLDNAEAVHVYEASLRYLIAMAFYRVYPEFEIKFKYSISRSIFCYIVDHEDIDLKPILQEINHEMDLLIQQDVPFIRATKPKEEAREFYAKHNYQDKIDILDYRPENRVHLYECDNYLNYMYSYMVPSTGYLKDYRFIPYDSGFLIQYPRSEANKQIPLFKDAPKYVETLRRASEWANVVRADYISNLNNHVVNENSVDFVHMCEAKHNALLTTIGDKVLNNKDQIRLIAIAGPSSSGKTTFSNRLRIELMTRGLRPVTISLDDYYLNREDIPTDSDGKVDLEHINTLDIELFNQNMKDLIEGKEVEMPVFDFTVKQRGGYRKLQVTSDNPIIIEGIHALNKRLTESIPKNQTFKIYISPQLQMNLDNHNPISITNLRLIRRIVRDKQFRNADAIRTISMWESVRAGEFRWIYPNQEQADFVYNSGLQYEMCVLKKYALPTLKEVPNDSEYYITANRLIKFLKYFVDIEDEIVPNNSLLREFIGGSCFRD
jgi:uridine kinase